MEVTPKTLRDAEFREVKRGGGYLHEDVDDFIEEVAKGVEVLHERLRQALERAQRAEAAASEVTNTDETLRRTLVLAQRTADLAVQEAREQASRILAGAESQAQAVLADAETRARRAHDEAVAGIHAELAQLEVARTTAQAEVDALQRWAGEERGMIVAGLREAAAAVERAGHAGPPPVAERPAPEPPSPVGHVAEFGDAPHDSSPPADAAAAGSAPPHVDEVAGESPAGGSDEAHRRSGPPTVAWADTGADTGEVPVARGNVDYSSYDGEIDEAALEQFFDDAGDGDDRRFGSRLRRRR